MTLARRNNPERFEMLQPAARLRAFAGALCCALVLIVALAHQVRADDNPARIVSAQEVSRLAVVRHASRAHRPRGASEVRATAAHPLVSTALRDLGRGKFTGKPGPWCADAAGAWLRRAGYRAPRSRRAIDYARYGRPTSPRPGAIVVSRHHVGVVVTVNHGRVTMVSGNWGGRVRIGQPTGVIAYRAAI